jgi:hypothetical protein
MRSSGRLFSLEKAARAQQVRAEIGRLAEPALRGEFAAHARPPRRANRENKSVRIPVRAGFQTREHPMSKPDEYCANAQECQQSFAISSAKAENLDADKRLVLDRLIANGFCPAG